ncbi:hypothetical protein VHEMI00386 [[Torrubiella] hemipterigena]|uniref:Methyltransferase type 11 domain-containing protein n=1 Tax=[Torrubiella] hemipterigena TaxID=1531966 RepID=A0A0A1T287_9HYPO|nr:hypothetical protein VHEMI00386 [[Torrubiella] hemipterigena]
MQSTASMLPVPERTFRSYDINQGRAYATGRTDYSPFVYEIVIKQHKQNGGQFGTLIDLGTGPGNVARALAPHFDKVIGLDPSAGMIDAAISIGGTCRTGDPIQFRISTAEDLGQSLDPPVLLSSVDLITVANTAHWFNMKAFWEAARQILKPGGCVAIWTTGDIEPHPDMPAGDKIEAAWTAMLDDEVRQYYMPGNILVCNRYRDLEMPWDGPEPVIGWDKSGMFRKEWTLDEEFFLGGGEMDMDTFEHIMDTVSSYTRWRAANPERAGTDRDVIKMIRKTIETLQADAGVAPGQARLKAALRGALLVVQKE